MGVWKLGGIFVHKSESRRFDEQSTLPIREFAKQEALNATQEHEAQQLAQAFAQAASDDFLQLARLLLAGLYALPEMGPLLRPLASRVGMEQAEVWIALTDGGSGLEAFMQQNFNRPDLVLILDFYHAASYLEKLAKASHPQDQQSSQHQAEQWCSLLKAEGGER